MRIPRRLGPAGTLERMTDQKRMQRVLTIWVTAFVLLLAAAVAGIMLVNQKVFGPQALVNELYGHLVAGEGGKALGLLGAEVPAGNAVLLDGEGLKNSIAPIKKFGVSEVSDVPGEKDSVEVTANYEVFGSEKSVTYQLHRAGRDWLFFDRWAFDATTLPVVTVSADTTTQIKVNGLDSPLAKGTQTLPVFAPSVVDASFSTPNFQSRAKSVLVNNPRAKPKKVELLTEPTDELIAAIDAKLRTYLDDCAEQNVLMPTGCPMSYRTNSRVNADSIKWSISSYPKPVLTAYDGAWILRPLEVGTRLTLTEQDLVTGKYKEREVDDKFGFTARIEVNTTTFSLTPVTSG